MDVSSLTPRTLAEIGRGLQLSRASTLGFQRFRCYPGVYLSASSSAFAGECLVQESLLVGGALAASNGAYGFEYCALHYYSGTEDAFFLSYLSDIGGTREGGRKYCRLPRTLDDLSHQDAVILGGAHSHPNNRRFSREDLSIDAQWRPTRLFDKTSGRIFDRELLLLYREKTGECRAYGYNNTTRVVSALRGGSWVPIGQVYNDNGDLRMFEGQDWLP